MIIDIGGFWEFAKRTIGRWRRKELEQFEVSQMVFVERINICSKCINVKYAPLSDEIEELKIFTRCGICGCFVEWKAKYIDNNCPLNKW